MTLTGADSTLQARCQNALPYRPDIDGLRGIAVLAVVLYHLGLGPLAGGFVGVDVFFVISGFLIAGIVQREIEQRRFTFSGFYERRIRRLFPALFVMLTITSACGLVLLLPSDLIRLGRSVVATLMFASNIYFQRVSAYFDPSAEVNPLLHTWTLAVEEQFYIVFPILLIVVHRHARAWLGPALAAAGLVSFVLCAWVQAHHPTATFYLSPFRAWELIVGALLAAEFVPALSKRWHRELAGGFGLVTLVFSMLATPSGMAFPGWMAAFPVLGTAVLIHAGSAGDSSVQRLLRMRPLVFVGLISYSLYLWHWPLLVFARYTNGWIPLEHGRWVVLAASLLVAAISFRWVERPFRRPTGSASRRPLFTQAALAMGTLAVAGFALTVHGGWSGRFDADRLALDAERHPDIPFLDCIDRPIESIRGRDVCHIGDANAQPEVLIWGDSHALAWLPAIDRILESNRLGGIFAGRSACPPLAGVRNPVSPQCFDHNDRVLQLLHADPHLRLVVLAAAWASYSTAPASYVIEDNAGRSGNATVFPRAMSKTVQMLHDERRSVWVIGQAPGAPSEASLRLALNRGPGELAPLPPDSPGFDGTAFYQVASTLPDETTLITDPRPWLCRDDHCRYELDGMPLYRDSGHLNARGARYLQPYLEQSFSQIAARTEFARSGKEDHPATDLRREPKRAVHVS